MNDLLERMKSSIEILNGFGGGDAWRAEPLRQSVDGAWAIRRGTYDMSDQLADVFAKVNWGEGDLQDAEGVAKAIAEARNTSQQLLAESAAEIERLRARVAELEEELSGKIKIDDFTWEWDADAACWIIAIEDMARPQLDHSLSAYRWNGAFGWSVNGQDGRGCPSLRVAMRAAIAAAKGGTE